MWGVALAYTAIAYCYFCIAFGGYWAFGNGVASNVMLSVGRPSWLVGVANLLVVIHVFGSYQVSSSSDCFANMSDCQLLSCGCGGVWAKGLDEALIQNPGNRMFFLLHTPASAGLTCCAMITHMSSIVSIMQLFQYEGLERRNSRYA